MLQNVQLRGMRICVALSLFTTVVEVQRKLHGRVDKKLSFARAAQINQNALAEHRRGTVGNS